jgi:hypothetical protein
MGKPLSSAAVGLARRAGFEPPEACEPLSARNSVDEKRLQQIRNQSKLAAWTILRFRMASISAASPSPRTSEKGRQKFLLDFPA